MRRKTKVVTRPKDYLKANAKEQRALVLSSPLANQYLSVVYDEMHEVLVPTSAGDLVRAIDICWRIAQGHSISDACLSMAVHPIRFMVYKTKHPQIDELVKAACELAGENDIRKAERLMMNLTNGNFDVSMAKSKFFVWRGKTRYSALYGEKPQVNIEANRTNIMNNFQLSNTIRSLEDGSTKTVELDASEYEEAEAGDAENFRERI